MAKKGETGVDFERSLNELEQLVERMEKGDLSLEESLKSFERGVALTRQCQKALDEAQQKVDKLLEKDGDVQVTAFEADDSDDNSPNGNA